MKKMSASEIRNMWLEFFKSKGHHIEPGSSLIPVNDPTLLWINAGVAPLKKYFDGSEIPPSRRISNAQKSIRTNDIDNVGHTARHHTFFEMLGNFSIGDYFRKEAIGFASELLFDDKWFGFPKEKLYITYHPDDLDTKRCWMENGVNEDHLIPLEGNFWEIGEGPCGPDTEMFFDRGEKYDPDNLGIKMLKEDIENERYVEIWNIVFSQFNSEPGKKRSEYKELPNKNIDTGAGLERFACIIQGTETNFETDLFKPIIDKVCSISNIKYDENHLAYRVIADHIRAITFALADGEMFSNEGRGYVLRRLLRRAERYGKVLGISHPFLSELVDVVTEIMKDFYPYLLDRKEFVKKMILAEEEKFLKTLSNGEVILLKEMKDSSSLSGEAMFKLYDTYGFPKELTMEICDENNVKYDLEGFNKCMKEQKDRAREARNNVQSMNKQSPDLMSFVKESKFTYGSKPIETTVIGLFKDGIKVDSISEEGDVIVEETIFYAESGGQTFDIGQMNNKDTSLKVVGVTKAPNKQHMHHVEVLFGEVKVGDKLTLTIDENRRARIARNHSSVHFLQKALTEVLGDHIAQHGSYVCEEYSHFDFSHFAKLSKEELATVERKVNEWINQAIPCETKVLPIEEAKKLGARALFNDKYGDVVRVVCFGDVSREFCGGTHVSNSEQIGLFTIESEESVSAGVRRITARTSISAYELMKKKENLLERIKDSTEVLSIYETPLKVNYLLQEKQSLKKENEILLDKLCQAEADKLSNEFIKKDDKNILSVYLKGKKRNELSIMIDKLLFNRNSSIIALFGEEENSIPLMVAVTPDLVLKGIKAGDIVKKVCEILSGSGGGRPELANGAGKNKDKISEAVDLVKGL